MKKMNEPMIIEEINNHIDNSTTEIISNINNTSIPQELITNINNANTYAYNANTYAYGARTNAYNANTHAYNSNNKLSNLIWAYTPEETHKIYKWANIGQLSNYTSNTRYYFTAEFDGIIGICCDMFNTVQLSVNGQIYNNGLAYTSRNNQQIHWLIPVKAGTTYNLQLSNGSSQTNVMNGYLYYGIKLLPKNLNYGIQSNTTNLLFTFSSINSTNNYIKYSGFYYVVANGNSQNRKNGSIHINGVNVCTFGGGDYVAFNVTNYFYAKQGDIIGYTNGGVSISCGAIYGQLMQITTNMNQSTSFVVNAIS